MREQVLQLTHDELPFSTAVVVDQFDEAERRTDHELYCTILVERESQKPIVVGKGGAMIKAIGTAARAELEEHFEQRVLPRPARQGEVRVARRRAAARRDRAPNREIEPSITRSRRRTDRAIAC